MVLLIPQPMFRAGNSRVAASARAKTLEHAGARETLEETGYRVVGPMQLFGHLPQFEPGDRPGPRRLLFVATKFEKAFERKPITRSPRSAGSTATPCPKRSPGNQQRITNISSDVPRRTVWGY